MTRWHHVRTPDGFEVRDENGLLVATVQNPSHDRVDDARLLADAPRLRERYELPVEAIRAELVQEMVAWITSTTFSTSRARRYQERASALAERLIVNRNSLLMELEREALAIVERRD